MTGSPEQNFLKAMANGGLDHLRLMQWAEGQALNEMTPTEREIIKAYDELKDSLEDTALLLGMPKDEVLEFARKTAFVRIERAEETLAKFVGITDRIITAAVKKRLLASELEKLRG